MFNAQIRSQIYFQIMESERFTRYYGELADKYRTRHIVMRFLILSSVLAEAVSVPALFGIGLSSAWIGIIAMAIAVVIVLFVAWESVSDYGTKVAKLDWVAAETYRLNSQWHILWTEIEAYRIEEDAALSKASELLDRFIFIAGRLDINTDTKISERSEKSGDLNVEGRYASQP